MKVDQLTGKVSQGVDEVRDRAAGALAGDGESVFRAIGRLADRIDQAESSIEARITDIEDAFADGLDGVSVSKRTTWPRRLFWLIVGMSAGAGFVLGFPEKAKDLTKKLRS